MSKFDELIYALHEKLMAGDISINELEKYKNDFEAYRKFVINSNNACNENAALRKFLLLCIDYYTFSSNGDVLIADSDFDKMMQIYCKLTSKSPIIFPDYCPPVTDTSWEIKNHIAPQMVGTVSKCYNFDSLMNWLESYQDKISGSKTSVMVAPKYDGVGVSIEYKEGQPIVALTRRDGISGQDISRLVSLSSNINEVINMGKVYTEGSKHFFIKAEMLISRSSFNKLKELTTYKNRRSATTGIINTPKNLNLAPWIDIMPLCYYDADAPSDKPAIIYDPGNKANNIGAHIPYYDAILKDGKLLKNIIKHMLKDLTDPDFEYRYDGVVVFINSKHLNYDSDIMEHSKAYKINTKKGTTRIKKAYVSVGRTGKATPMIEVYPCDVNETEVTDVSLSNFTKARALNLHEGDIVAIISAGDVIPQVEEVIETRSNIPLSWDMKCPHCGIPFKSYRNSDNEKEYRCENSGCIRVLSGMITNFFEKMGAENISDATISFLCENVDGVKSLVDILNIKKEQLVNLDGWGELSASAFVDEIERIKNAKTPYSTFLGALGIASISKKKCRKILKGIKYSDLMDWVINKPSKVEDRIMAMDGVGPATAKIFIDFIADNYENIRGLEKYFNLVPDKNKCYNVVFTQFRNRDYINKIKSMGFEISENVNKETIAVISPDMHAKKMLKAKERGIITFHASELDYMIERLEDFKFRNCI